MVPTWTRDEKHFAVRGTAIGFAVGECSRGAILVAATRNAGLLQDRQDRFPTAQPIDGDNALQLLMLAMVEAIEKPARRLDLPFDLPGASFRRRVCQALREIPAGATARYRGIANRIDAPNSVRAVARACAANAFAVAIPCHLVVRSEGAPSGCRWGAACKRARLDRDAA
jgi:AraC family transcriptional regulator, regulatory protein of adaptative response / methylated-DNA-[protein]-cysteine methyltransferase